MRKLLCVFTIFVTCFSISKAFADDMYPPTFANKLRTCSPYKDEYIFTIREIKGWRNGKCLYQKSNSSGSIETQCYFTNAQIAELSRAMKNNQYNPNQALKVKYSNGVEAIYTTGSLATNIWSKYLNMPGVCVFQRQRQEK